MQRNTTLLMKDSKTPEKKIVRLVRTYWMPEAQTEVFSGSIHPVQKTKWRCGTKKFIWETAGKKRMMYVTHKY